MDRLPSPPSCGRQDHSEDLARGADGNFGDVKYSEGIGEMRIHDGPGYRLYVVRRVEALVILLYGGAKASQKRDIRRATDMAKEV